LRNSCRPHGIAAFNIKAIVLSLIKHGKRPDHLNPEWIDKYDPLRRSPRSLLRHVAAAQAPRNSYAVLNHDGKTPVHCSSSHRFPKNRGQNATVPAGRSGLAIPAALGDDMPALLADAGYTALSSAPASKPLANDSDDGAPTTAPCGRTYPLRRNSSDSGSRQQHDPRDAVHAKQLHTGQR
jgi:hypothetical protein